jgi:serine/threonine protein kinase/tetratricopeptide (TPR) repeat protein
VSRERFERLDAIFREALRRPAAAREAFLDAACGDDAGLRAEVDALLAEDRATRGALDEPALGPGQGGDESPVARAAAALHREPTELIGGRIGPYRLLEEIGEGGFGVVYMAEQSEPVRRRVALKVIKLGMDTRQVIARFEAERQALALMDHPHIATVLDAGSTTNGRPFFVMELCAGTPITEYCREHALSIPARLELAGQVCRAVQHAHQKGVIHRDIKPGNVLVETRDGRPFARVIDFGIAKATEARLTERTYFTEHRQMIGTPEYMSPEQAEGLADVDTRTDVYALGVLLYELLSGRTPHDARDLRSAAWGEIQRIIREVEPPPPSTRRGRAGRGPDAGADARASAAADDSPASPRGELDWIVMKALAKERDRRYQSAGELAADLEHHLAGLPVSAAPPSRVYRVRTFVRRNRGLVAGAGVLGVVLTAGVIGTSWGLLQALDAREAADAAATRAEARAAELEQVAGFQAAQLAGIDPAEVGARMREAVETRLPEDVPESVPAALEPLDFTGVALNTLQEDILQPALDAARAEFPDQPLVRARLLQSLADAGRDLGLLDFAEGPQREAIEIRERELGAEAPESLDSVSRLVILLIEQARHAEAEPIARQSVERHRRVLGLTADTLNAIGAHGAVLRALERLDEALPLYREAYEGNVALNGPDDPSTLIALNNMGFIRLAVGDLDGAEQAFRDTLAGRERALGPDDSRTLASRLNLAGMLRQRGRLDEAEPLYVEAVAGHRRLHGDRHPRTLRSIGNLGVFHTSAGQWEQAVEALGEAVDGHAAVVGPEAVFTMIYAVHLGIAEAMSGRFDAAQARLEHARDVADRDFGPDSPTSIRSRLGLAILTRERGDVPAAIEQLEPLRERAIEAGGADWPFTAEVAATLAKTREMTGSGEDPPA